MKKILVVDDEDKIRIIIKKYAEFEGYAITEASNGMEAIEACQREDFDLIIMDVMMPELDGFSACKEIKKIKDIPVIMLSARGEEYDKIHGFESGVDDYVVKPFSPKELMMRVNVVITRNARNIHNALASNGINEQEHDVYRYEGLEVDFTSRMVTVDGINASMTPKEYDLLFYMIRNKGIALTREKLITEVWGYDYFGDDRTLDTHIKLLRGNLGEYRSLVTTLRGVGYRFDGV